jgi:hypothetical protein
VGVLTATIFVLTPLQDAERQAVPGDIPCRHHPLVVILAAGVNACKYNFLVPQALALAACQSKLASHIPTVTVSGGMLKDGKHPAAGLEK